MSEPAVPSLPLGSAHKTQATLTKEDQQLIDEIMKEQKTIRKKKRKADKEAKRKRKASRARARKAKETFLQAATEDLKRDTMQQTAPSKRRLSALDRDTMKRYGLYENGISEFMHKDEGNARPVAKLLDILVDRISRRQSTSSRVESFKIFLPHTQNRGKITKDSLREGIKSIGLTFMKEECDSVFDQVDKNGDGDIDYNEFVQALMGDKPQMLRNVASGIQDQLRTAQKRQLQMLRHMGQDGNGNRWAIGKAKNLLVQKILQKVKGGPGATRAAFRYFQDSLDKAGVNVNSFNHGLRAVGMMVPADMAWALYNSFDANGDGVISYEEFRMVIQDYQKAKLEEEEKQKKQQLGTSRSRNSRNSRNSRPKNNRPGTAGSQRSHKSTVTLKRLETLGLLRPRTAQHHKKRSIRNMPAPAKLATSKTVKRGMPVKQKPVFLRALNRKWNIHATNAYVHGNQPFAERHFSSYHHNIKKAI